MASGCLAYEDYGKGDSLKEYFALYSSEKGERNQEKFKNVQQKLREQIVEKLKKDEAYKRLFKKELLLFKKELLDIDKGKGTSGKKAETEADLIRFIDSAGPEQLEGMNRDEAKAMVREFHGFTTYFSGFYENRKNMYSTEEKPTGIAYRLINENLPKFVDNMDSFQKIAAIPEMEANISNLYSDFEEYLNVRDIREMFQLDYYNNLLTQKQIDVYNAIIGGKTSGEHGKKIKGINEYINLYNQQHKESKLPKLKVLFKQILSDRNAISWLPEEFHNDQEVLYAIKDCYERLKEKVLDEKGLENLLHNLSEYDDKG